MNKYKIINNNRKRSTQTNLDVYIIKKPKTTEPKIFKGLSLSNILLVADLTINNKILMTHYKKFYISLLKHYQHDVKSFVQTVKSKDINNKLENLMYRSKREIPNYTTIRKHWSDKLSRLEQVLKWLNYDQKIIDSIDVLCDIFKHFEILKRHFYDITSVDYLHQTMFLEDGDLIFEAMPYRRCISLHSSKMIRIHNMGNDNLSLPFEEVCYTALLMLLDCFWCKSRQKGIEHCIDITEEISILRIQRMIHKVYSEKPKHSYIEEINNFINESLYEFAKNLNNMKIILKNEKLLYLKKWFEICDYIVSMIDNPLSMIDNPLFGYDSILYTQHIKETDYGKLCEEQQTAFKKCVNNPITFINGAGGTGKTKIAECLIQYYTDLGTRFMAPTGVASISITKRIRKYTKTDVGTDRKSVV